MVPESVRDLFALANVQIRWAFLDVARKVRKEQSLQSAPAQQMEPSRSDPLDLMVWTDLHEQIAQLPDLLREVFELKYYHQLSEREIAELLEVSQRTVRYRWREARLELHRRLHGDWPEL